MSPAWRLLRAVVAVIPRLAGMVCVLVGLATMLGWHTGIRPLFQITPNIVPLQYNAALALVFLGIASVAGHYRARSVERFSSLVPLVLGFLTLGEYVFEADLGIDQFLFTHYVTVGVSHPGRFAPNTAVCWTAGGLALLLHSFKGASQERPMLLGVLGAILLGVGGLALAGYIGGIEQVYGWGPYTRMAPQAAFGALVLSASVMRLAWTDVQEVETAAVRWVPMAVAAFCFTSILVLWQAVLVLAQRLDPGMGDLENALAATFITAAGMALMMATAVFIGQRATTAATNLRRLNEVLEREKEERHRAFLAAARLAAIVESSDDAILRTDLDQRILTWNASAEQTYGYTTEEAIGQPLSMLLPDERTNELPEVFDRLRSGEHIAHYETVRRRKDGCQVDVSMTLSPIRDASGVIVGASSIARDVSERKRLEAARNQLLADLQSALTEVRTLSRLLPICAWCKKIRDDKGYWNELEGYLNAHSGLSFSHGICPACAEELGLVDGPG